jgi:hypothetical protein
MKKFLAAFSIVLISLSFLQAAPNGVQITVTKQVDKGERPRPEGEGSEARLVSTLKYDIKVASAGFADLADLKVDYIIFVERQQLGKKKDVDVTVRMKGSDTIPALTKKEPKTVTSIPVELSKSNLVGNYTFVNGGRIKVEDSVKGVWVRVTQGDKLVGEYANPSTITSRGWDEK